MTGRINALRAAVEHIWCCVISVGAQQFLFVEIDRRDARIRRLEMALRHGIVGGYEQAERALRVLEGVETADDVRALELEADRG